MIGYENRSVAYVSYESTGRAEAGHLQTGFTENP